MTPKQIIAWTLFQRQRSVRYKTAQAKSLKELPTKTRQARECDAQAILNDLAEVGYMIIPDKARAA